MMLRRYNSSTSCGKKRMTMWRSNFFSHSMLAVLLSLSLLSLVVVNGFSLASVPLGRGGGSICTTSKTSLARSPSSSRCRFVHLLHMNGKNKDVPQINNEQLKDIPSIVEFPTPTQKKLLRKEVSKRIASKKLGFVTLKGEDEEDGIFQEDSDTMNEIVEYLTKQEFVEIKGIARSSNDNTKYVYTTAENIAIEIEYILQQDVTLLSTKGHSAIFYSPMKDDEVAIDSNDKEDGEETSSTSSSSSSRKVIEKYPKIILRTSVGQKNTWVRREKAPRDNRGQIIKD